MSSSLFARFITFPYIFWQVTENKSQCLFKQISRGKNPKLLRCKLFYKHVKLKQNACNNRRPLPTLHTTFTEFSHFLSRFRSISCHTQKRKSNCFATVKACKKLEFLWKKVRLQLWVLPALSSFLSKVHAKELRNVCIFNSYLHSMYVFNPLLKQ